MISDEKNATVLQVKNLGYRRGGEWLFRGVSFDIHAGQIVWLRGKNGRGKTSLLRLLVGLAQADEGTIAHGDEAAPDTLPTRTYVGHANALKEDLTSIEALQCLMQLQGRKATPEAVIDAMRKFSIQGRRHQTVKTLSQGQRRRVALSRLALQNDTGFWVLDEPFDALDAQGIEVLCTLMREHTKRGGAVLLTSHIPVESGNSLMKVLDLDTLAPP